MSPFLYHISEYGEQALLVQVQEHPSKELLNWLLAKINRFQKMPGVTAWHTYNEILVKSIESSVDTMDLKEIVREIIELPESSQYNKANSHQIPVCYHENYGIDLVSFASSVNLSVRDVIELHTKPKYTLYFLGFLPGFPYMEGLDRRLFLPRKSNPSRKIPNGGVGIGGKQTGIYPQESPGGWHIIGQTPIELFNISLKNPSPFQAGDTIEFYEIGEEEFHFLKNPSGSDQEN